MIHILTTRPRKLSKVQERIPVELVRPGADWTASFEPGDLVYLDLEDVVPDRQADILESFASRCRENGCHWALLDVAGRFPDPARAFFAGAVDYIGTEPGLAGIQTKRLKLIQAWIDARAAASSAGSKRARTGNGSRAEGRIERAGADGKRRFPGWKRLAAGERRAFHLLYIAPEDQAGLKRRLGEAQFDILVARLETQVRERLAACDPLLWMQSEGSLLYLVPVEGARPACMIEALLRFFLDLPLLAVERFALPLALPVVCAIHRGELPFVPPGSTGSLVSEPVNFIFHLGAKRAESGRISLSADARAAIPPVFGDLFVPQGSFEGREIIASRRFRNRE